MARPKRPPHPMLGVAQSYLVKNMPRLKDAPLKLHYLDGPPGSPRYSVSAHDCMHRSACPLGVDEETAYHKCPFLNCQMRESVRLLIDTEGQVINILCSGTRWD